MFNWLSIDICLNTGLLKRAFVSNCSASSAIVSAWFNSLTLLRWYVCFWCAYTRSPLGFSNTVLPTLSSNKAFPKAIDFNLLLIPIPASSINRFSGLAISVFFLPSTIISEALNFWTRMLESSEVNNLLSAPKETKASWYFVLAPDKLEATLISKYSGLSLIPIDSNNCLDNKLAWAESSLLVIVFLVKSLSKLLAMLIASFSFCLFILKISNLSLKNFFQ